MLSHKSKKIVLLILINIALLFLLEVSFKYHLQIFKLTSMIFQIAHTEHQSVIGQDKMRSVSDAPSVWGRV